MTNSRHAKRKESHTLDGDGTSNKSSRTNLHNPREHTSQEFGVITPREQFSEDYFFRKGYTKTNEPSSVHAQFENREKNIIFKYYSRELGEIAEYQRLFVKMNAIENGPFAQVKKIIQFTDSVYVGTEIVEIFRDETEFIKFASEYALIYMPLGLIPISQNTQSIGPYFNDFLLVYAYCLHNNIMVFGNLKIFSYRGYKLLDHEVSYRFGDSSISVIEPNTITVNPNHKYVQTVLLPHSDWKIASETSEITWCRATCQEILAYLTEREIIKITPTGRGRRKSKRRKSKRRKSKRRKSKRKSKRKSRQR